MSVSLVLCVWQCADKCAHSFQSPQLLKPTIGSSHADETKYNAKFIQMCEICIPGILVLRSSLEAGFLQVPLVYGGAASSRAGTELLQLC